MKRFMESSGRRLVAPVFQPARRAGWVAQATRLFRSATRRTERKPRVEEMGTRFSPLGLSPFRSAGRQPGRASRPRHPFWKHLSVGFVALGFWLAAHGQSSPLDLSFDPGGQDIGGLV